MDVDDEMRRASKAATEATVGQLVKGAIYNLTSEGHFLSLLSVDCLFTSF